MRCGLQRQVRSHLWPSVWVYHHMGRQSQFRPAGWSARRNAQMSKTTTGFGTTSATLRNAKVPRCLAETQVIAHPGTCLALCMQIGICWEDRRLTLPSIMSSATIPEFRGVAVSKGARRFTSCAHDSPLLSTHSPQVCLLPGLHERSRIRENGQWEDLFRSSVLPGVSHTVQNQP